MSASSISSRAASRRFHRTLCSVVLLAFALAQTLGLVHRIVHSPLAVHATAASRASAHPATDWVKAVFAGHTTEQGCELYDQLSYADLMLVEAAVVAPLHTPEAHVPVHPAWHFATQTAGFLARGPPRTT